MISLITKLCNIIFAWKQECLDGKNPLLSKTIWSLILTWVTLILSKNFGFELSSEEQVTIIMFIGIILRFITKQPIGFYEEK